ncbi:MAG: GLUG motif-containing protein, partial [Candidatus Undinarchaeales archaeon]
YFKIDTSHYFDGSASVKARGESEMSPQAVWTEAYKDFTPASPESIVFSKRIGDEIRPHFTDLHRVRFQSDSNPLFTFDFLTEGGNPPEMVTITSGCDDLTDAFPTQTWITVNIKNIDWSAGTYDFTATDGSQTYEKTGCLFENSGSTVNRIYTKDKAYNAEPSWTDSILFKTSEKQCPAKLKSAEDSVELLTASNIDDWADHYGTYEENPIPKLNLESEDSGEFDLTVLDYFGFVKSSTLVENNEIEVYFDEEQNDYFVHTLDAELEVSGTEEESIDLIFQGVDSDGNVGCSYSKSIIISNSIPVSFSCDQMIQKVSAEASNSGGSEPVTLEELTVSTNLYGMGYSEIEGHASEPLKVSGRGIEVSASSAFKERIPAETDVKPDFSTDYLKVIDSNGNELTECKVNPTEGDIIIESRYSNDGCADSSSTPYLYINDPSGDPPEIYSGSEPSFHGESVVISHTWTPHVAGIYELTAKIDKDDNIPEEDETNNILSMTFEVIDTSVISTCQDLQDMMLDLSADYYLTQDIDCTGFDYGDGKGFMPIGDSELNAFTGSFYGQNHTISNLYIDRPESAAGLFSFIDGAHIENVGIENADITGGGYVGTLVGYSSGEIYNSYSTGQLSGGVAVGGLVGENFGTVSNCYSDVSVNGGDFVGGLVGENFDTVSNSYSSGQVTGNNDIGGLIGGSFGNPVYNSFWDIETSGQLTSDGGTGKTTSEMQDVATFTDTVTIGLDSPWDFETNPNDDTADEDIWYMPYSNYPRFVWEFADSVCGPGNCGNGIVEGGEECDTGGVDTASCVGVTCCISVCGDGYVNEVAGEECDTGVDTEECNYGTCQYSVCGDGYVNEVAGEECDTGGVDTEECNAATCQFW